MSICHLKVLWYHAAIIPNGQSLEDVRIGLLGEELHVAVEKTSHSASGMFGGQRIVESARSDALRAPVGMRIAIALLVVDTHTVFEGDEVRNLTG